MENSASFDDRQPVIDQVDIQNILAGGPSVPRSEVVPEVPPIPQGDSPLASPVSNPPQEGSHNAPVPDEGPDENTRDQMILPSEQEQAALKAKYGLLRVVPIPYMRADGKIQTYVLRQLIRSQWRATEEAATKIAEAKPGISAEEIFQEKIVSLATVWPPLPEHQIAISPPGLVPTLFGIVQQMGLFFNPEAIMAVTFVL